MMKIKLSLLCGIALSDGKGLLLKVKFLALSQGTRFCHSE